MTHPFTYDQCERCVHTKGMWLGDAACDGCHEPKSRKFKHFEPKEAGQ